MKSYRDNGAIGALLDEYERTIMDLKEVIFGITNQELSTSVDTTTKDPDCISIQTILSHVIKAGYTYAIEIQKHFGEELSYRKNIKLENTTQYIDALDTMFAYHEMVLLKYPKLDLEEYDNDKKIIVRWGQRYDTEQLFEHAIVHVLRHRRQIERFLVELRN